MYKVAFEYRSVNDPESCLFKATSLRTGEVWSVEIPLPYAFENNFWYADQFSSEVVNKSRQLAKKHNAPEWVYG